jgi:hypothetical protein
MNVQIQEVRGKLLEKIPFAGYYLQIGIQQALKDASALIWRLTIEKAPTSTGTLKKSINRDLFPTYAKIYPTVKYGIYVHEGTRPHWPPLIELKPGGSLYRWAQKKGIPVFLVARAIARKGTKAQPWMANIADNQKDAVEQIFLNELAKVVEKLGD